MDAPPLKVDAERNMGRSVELRPGYHETRVSITFHNSPQQQQSNSYQDETRRVEESKMKENFSVQCELFPDKNEEQYKSVQRNVWNRLEQSKRVEHESSSGPSSHSEVGQTAMGIVGGIESGFGMTQEETLIHNGNHFQEDMENYGQTEDIASAHNVKKFLEISATPNIRDRHQQQDEEEHQQNEQKNFQTKDVSEPLGSDASRNSHEKHQQQDKEKFYQTTDIYQSYEQEPFMKDHGIPPWDAKLDTKATKLQLSLANQAHFNRYHWEKGTRREDRSWKSVPQVILHGVPKHVRFLVPNVRPVLIDYRFSIVENGLFICQL